MTKLRFSTSRLGRAAVAVGLAVSLAGTASAALTWYDGFNTTATGGTYVAGPIGGQAGGTGTFFKTNAGTPWEQQGTNPESIDATSLTKPGLIHPSIGGEVIGLDADCCGRNRQIMTAPWVPGRAPNIQTGTFYIGFLANFGTAGALLTHNIPDPNDPTGVATISVPTLDANGDTAPDTHFRSLEMWNSLVANPTWQGNPDSSRHLRLGYSTFGDFGLPGGIPNGGQTGTPPVAYQAKLSLNVHDDTGGGSGTGADIVQVLNPASPLEFRHDGMTHCIVLRIDLSSTAKSDEVRAYLDPMGSIEPAASADISGIDFTADSMGAISQFVFNNPRTGVRFDELRVGSAFADVACMTPEPASIVMSIVGAIGLLLLKKRK